ncbi:carboxypeptidase regulatory-like domain-containing protein [Segetibacter sp.]|uniref:TonB-dependent receptor n=1 Tax=Segetibacter sp. TaxID=2231182 RepID=UPI00262B4C1A|nr:carboxypeptidase regulatory-like domain-containing protein [Segetibacter sp.]MCW3080466.1 TonB-dependent receptor [Segetibacter sp.]
MLIKRITPFILTFLAPLYLLAQETTSEIQGIITNENNAALAGATIVAVHIPTNTSYSTTSRKDGHYNLPNVRVGGPYQVAASYIGFKAETQSDIGLALGVAYKADFKLSTASTALAEVTVTTNRTDRVFSKSRTGSAEVIGRQQIERLPTINRSLQDFTRLTPTANGSSFGGRSGSLNNLTVNGASFNNTFGLSGPLGGQTNSQPISIDALDQIQVNIAPYDVTLGNFTGAGINSVTRSGTNEFKGSVYYYKKTPGLTGRKVGAVELAKQQFDFNNRGATIGGPIIKNKLFFFLSGEQQRETAPATSFSASRNGSTGTGISTAKAEDLEVLAQFLKTKYNYDAGPFENYNYDTYSDKITARIDLNISKKHTLNINYYYLKSFRNVPPSNSGAPTGGRSASNTGMPFFASSYIINNNFNIVIAELNSRISNTLSNKLQIGYNRLRDYRSSPGGVFPLVDIENGAGSTFTSFGYEPFSAFNILSTDTYQFNDVVSLFKGKHSITFGTQNTYNKFKNGFAPNYYGAYRFRNLADFYQSANNGTANASRYEVRYSARKGGEFPYAGLGVLQLGLFAQDKWSVTNNFVLTGGIRADLPKYDNTFIPNTNADALVYRDGVRISTAQGPKASILWSPRLGFNWDATNNRKTQVRGGLGIFAGAPPFVYLSNQASNNGVDFGSKVITSGLAFNPDVNANKDANAAANTAYNLAITDRNFKFPQIFRANLAVDRKLLWDITGTLEGIYTQDINAIYHQNINLPSTGTPLSGSDQRIRYTSAQIYSGAGGATATNPNISDAILMRNTSKGYAYNLTLQLQRNVNGLYTMAAYSYGKSKSVNDGGSIAQSIWRDRFVAGDPNEDVMSYSSFHQPHRVVVAAFYRKEYLKHLATSIGFTFEAANGGTASYIYSGDINRDGQTVNDLIYVPKDQNDIVLETVNSSDTRTTQEIWNQLNTYIQQDPYLDDRRGMYAERNGLLLPFYKKLDLNFTQDFMLKVGGKQNTLRFTADIFNFSNLLNKNWGVFQTANRTGLLTLKRVETTGTNAGKPVFSFPYLDATNKIPLSSSFQNSVGLGSRYQVQLGIRYIFN